LLRRLEPIEVVSVLLFRNRASGYVATLDSIPPHQPEISMTITAAHISPIVALIAGVLILLMPRFLNFIVAIYLIVVGLAGLGVFKMFRF
jgi:hypothetical protein